MAAPQYDPAMQPPPQQYGYGEPPPQQYYGQPPPQPYYQPPPQQPQLAQQQTTNNVVVVQQQAGQVNSNYIYLVFINAFLSIIDSSASTKREALSSSSLHHYLFLLAVDLCLAPYVLHIWMLDEKVKITVN